MNLAELYAQTPAAKHENIVTSGNRVYVRNPEGTEEYLLELDGEIRLIKSDKDIRTGLERIRANLGA